MTSDAKSRVIAAVVGLRDLPLRPAAVLADLLTAYQREAQTTVRAHGGSVVRFAGDALAAIWSREPRRAAGMALQMAAVVRDLANEFDAPLEVAVGISDAEFWMHAKAL